MTDVLDAGALLRIERGDRKLMSLVARERLAGRTPVTHGGIVGQVWRAEGPRQGRLAKALRGIEVVPIDEDLGKRAGRLLAAARATDVIDASVVLLARDGDRIWTTDPADLSRLATAAGLKVGVVSI